MSTHVVGRLLAFRNLADGDEICDHETLVQVTDARSDGCVEIAFDMPPRPANRAFTLRCLLARSCAPR
jgi:hypothetical protein